MGAKNNKRELILEAAQNIFFEKGYHNATSEEIAKRAGVAKGTLYQYFSSKQEIFLEMHRIYIEHYVSEIGDCIDETGSFEENIRRIVHFHMANVHNLIQYSVRIVPEVMATSDDKDRDCQVMLRAKGQMDVVMERLIDAGQQRGELKAMDKRVMLYSISGLFLGIAHMLATHKFTDEEKLHMEEELVQNILHGVAR